MKKRKDFYISPRCRDWGDRVLELRMSLGMTQRELADKLGTNQGAVSDWELYKKRPHPRNLQRLNKLAETED